MKLKIDANGNAVLQDGKPVYIKDDGSEIAADVPGLFTTLSARNAEAKSHREAKEAAEAKLKAFEGIDDPAKARDALSTIANLDAKKLVDAGEIEKVKAEISKAFQGQLDEAKTAAQKLEQQLYAEKVGGAFARSKFIADKLAIPTDMAQARFEKQFSIEDGRIVAKDAHGNKLYSKANPGELANLDEALEMLVDQYPYKDLILKGPGASGGGAPAGNSGHGGGKPSTTDWSKASTADRVAMLKAQNPNLGKE